jgi:preprotein translocase subunit SecA
MAEETMGSAVGGDGFWQRMGGRLREVLDAAPVAIARGVNRTLKFFMGGSRIQRVIREMQPAVNRINALEPETVRLSDEELRAKTEEFRRRLAEGEDVEDILPNVFAVAREAADRRIGMCSVFKPRARVFAFDLKPEEFQAEPYLDPSRLKHPRHRELFEECCKRLAAGARLSELMLPASFYDEIRELFPEYRPPCRMRPFDVQLIGGMVLHEGKIAEMVTGEGKTLVATLPAYLNALAGTHVHIVTVNDYLARRDRHWNGPMYEALGLTVGAIQSEMNSTERQPEYAAHITYGTNNEFGFDYLRDNMKDRVEEQVQGRLEYAIIDEVDSILIDEARTPLIISGPAEESSDRYYIANRLVNTLHGANAQRLPREEDQRDRMLQNYDYTFNLKDHSVALTERGIKAAQRFLSVDNLYHGRNMEWPPYLEAALKAKELYKLDVDYVIREGEVVIVDEFTGRLMPGRRWSDGLHQAVEAKEASHGARIKEENQTLATITFQNFFRLYKKIAGMTGTALTEAAEFMKIYKLDVLPIPTDRPLRRTEHQDLIFGTEPEKWGAIVEEIANTHRSGRPMLVGTISIERSEHLSRLLERRGIKHEVLNAKHHEREAGIVALAGQFGAVTVATNMAGRGTDIVLGACPWQQVFRHWQESDLVPRDWAVNVGREELQRRLERHWIDLWGLRKPSEDGLTDAEVRRRLEAYWEERGMAPLVLGDSVAELGGLHIVGTERHEARRIDNQLRGRAGRQGDPGSSRFFVSLEDELMRIFMAEWVRNFMLRAGLSDGQPIESGMVSRAIERAQKKVEEHNFDIRKSLLEYDEVMDEQRKLIYSQRQEVLEGGERRDPAETIERTLSHYLAPDLRPPSRKLPDRVYALLRALTDAVDVPLSREEWEEATGQNLGEVLAGKARAALPAGLGAEKVRAWVAQIVADCRADGGAYPEQWRFERLARWASRLGAEVSRDELTALVRKEIAGFVADAAREELGRKPLDDVLTRWFRLGYEQDAMLLSRSIHWELETFRAWLDRVGVSIEFVEWGPSTTTCEALLPRWLAAAREKFAAQAVAEAAARLAGASADLFLGSGMFRRRPEAVRVALWAGERLDLRLEPPAVEAAFTGRVLPRLIETLTERVGARLKDVRTAEACDLWAKSAADWHLETHLRFGAHNVIGLATQLSARLRVGLNSFELAKKPAAEIPDLVLEKLAQRGEGAEAGEHFEGLEDIVLMMAENSVSRLVAQALGDRAGAAAAERAFVPLSTWAVELGLSVTERQWRAYDLYGLRLHFLRQAAEAYPATRTEELAGTFIPRFIRKTVGLFLGSEGFREQPSYAGLAGWASERFSFVPRDTQAEAQIKRFADDKLKEVRRHLAAAKLAEYRQAATELETAVKEMARATLDLHQASSEGDEVDLAGTVAFARQVFDVSIQVHQLEERAETEEREPMDILVDLANGRYARRGVEKLVADAVDGAFGLCLPAEQFPSEWRCEKLREWLRAVGLSEMVAAEDLRDEVVEELTAYFEKGATGALAARPAEQARGELVSVALQVFVETDLTTEDRNFIGLVNAVGKKYGIELDPFELSKLGTEELEELLRDQVFRAYETRKRELGTRRMLWTIRQLLLQTIDLKWKDHLYNMDHLRGVIGFRGYGQQDPKVEYKREGYSMFDQMTKSIEDTVTDYLLKVEFNLGEEEARHVWRADSYVHEAAESYKQQQQAAEAPQGERTVARSVTTRKEPGRNDPCPCGKTRADGKPVKYKNCCGRRAKSTA